MKALVYRGRGRRCLEDRPRPDIRLPTDAIVRVTNATICGSDPNAVKSYARPIARGRILGCEGTGIVEQVGDDVSSIRVSDCVLISCLTSCGMCVQCRKGEKLSCENGGCLLGSAIDGTRAEYVRVPFADHGLFPITVAVDDHTEGPWIDNFHRGFMGSTFHGPNEPVDMASIVFGGSIGMGPLLAVMQYYRTVVRPILNTGGNRRLQLRAGARHSVFQRTNGPTARPGGSYI